MAAAAEKPGTTVAPRYRKPRGGERLVRYTGLWKLQENVLLPTVNRRYSRFHQRARAAYAADPPSQDARLAQAVADLAADGLCHAGAGLPRDRALALSRKFTELLEAGGPRIAQHHRGSFRLNEPLDALGLGCLDLFDGPAGEVLRRHYGSHFRIEWVDCYRTHADAERRTSWLWHIDNVPTSALKVMLLLTDADRETGAMRYIPRPTTRALRRAGYFGIHLRERKLDLSGFAQRAGVSAEARFREAPAGDTLVFDPNILHCGEPPQRGYRDVMTFLMVPSLQPWRDALALTGTARVQSQPGGFPSSPEI